jgi:hypothetical protein
VEQEAGIQQINQAICEMDTVTQQNAALVEEVAAAAASVQDLASALERVVGVFKLRDEAQPQRAQVTSLPSRPTAAPPSARILSGWRWPAPGEKAARTVEYLLLNPGGRLQCSNECM